MKPLCIGILLIVFYSSNAVYAQKNSITLGVFYLPASEQAVLHTSLAYFRSANSNHALGLKTMYTADAQGISEYGFKTTLLNLDLLYRWNVNLKRAKSKLRLDAGVSLGCSLETVPVNGLHLECAVGASEKKIKEMVEYNAVQHDYVTFYPGIASAIMWDFPLSNRLNLGLGLALNVYYGPKKSTPQVQTRGSVIPNLNASYAF